MRSLSAALVRLDRAAALLLFVLVRAYQLLVSPLLGPVCRYAPSCSSYGATALRQHGAVRGCWLVLRRLLRCHPWAAGGWDPVPPRRTGPRPARAAGRRPHTGAQEAAPHRAPAQHCCAAETPDPRAHRDHGPARPEPARTR